VRAAEWLPEEIFVALNEFSKYDVPGNIIRDIP